MANIKKQLNLRQRKIWQALKNQSPETDSQRLVKLLRAMTQRLQKNPIKGTL